MREGIGQWVLTTTEKNGEMRKEKRSFVMATKCPNMVKIKFTNFFFFTLDAIFLAEKYGVRYFTTRSAVIFKCLPSGTFCSNFFLLSGMSSSWLASNLCFFVGIFSDYLNWIEICLRVNHFYKTVFKYKMYQHNRFYLSS